MGIRLSSGSPRPQSPKGCPLYFLKRFPVPCRRMAGNALRLVISISASADSARSVPQRLRFRRSRPGQRALARNLSLKLWTFSPIKGRSFCRDETASPPPGPAYGRGLVAASLRAMELITILTAAIVSGVLSTSTPNSVPTRRASEEAFQLWEYNSPAWARKSLDEWCPRTMRSRIGPMKKIARSLRQLTGPIRSSSVSPIAVAVD